MPLSPAGPIVNTCTNLQGTGTEHWPRILGNKPGASTNGSYPGDMSTRRTAFISLSSNPLLTQSIAVSMSANKALPERAPFPELGTVILASSAAAPLLETMVGQFMPGAAG